MNLGFIGAFFAVLASVFLPPGNVEQVYIGWGRPENASAYALPRAS